MKFTKITSAVLASASVLSMFAVPATSFAKTTTGSIAANGGTSLPQQDKTVAGISFGDNKTNGNTGYLRLQKVPVALDFGNHAKFYDTTDQTFYADGTNLAHADNDTHASYDNTDANKTAVLPTTDDDLKDVKDKVWATVVDKQVTRDQTQLEADNAADPAAIAGTTQAAGDWTLSVKSEGDLTASNDAKLSDGVISLKNTAMGHTQAVFGLTNEDQDEKFADEMTASTASDKGLTDVGTVADNIVIPLSDTTTEHQVAAAAVNQGTGANVFGWSKTDVQLVLPKNTEVNNAIYTADLTWTLSAVK